MDKVTNDLRLKAASLFGDGKYVISGPDIVINSRRVRVLWPEAVTKKEMFDLINCNYGDSTDLVFFYTPYKCVKMTREEIDALDSKRNIRELVFSSKRKDLINAFDKYKIHIVPRAGTVEQASKATVPYRGDYRRQIKNMWRNGKIYLDVVHAIDRNWVVENLDKLDDNSLMRFKDLERDYIKKRCLFLKKQVQTARARNNPRNPHEIPINPL